MNNNSGRPPINRRRDIMTPAMRKAEQERKLLAQKSATEQKNTLPPSRTSAAPRADTRSSVASSGAARTSSRSAEEERRILLERKRQLELRQRQLDAKNREQAQQKAKINRITELEGKIAHQKALGDSYRAKAEKPSGNIFDKKHIKVIAASAIVLLLVINVIAFSGIIRKGNTDSSENPQDNTPAAPDITATDSEETTVSTEIMSVISDDYVRGTLVLVNGDHAYNFDYVPQDIPADKAVGVQATLNKLNNTTYKGENWAETFLNETALNRLTEMMTEFHSLYKKTDVMVQKNAIRSFNQQQEIYNNKVKELGKDQTIAQLPGYSEHHTGYAFDLAIYPANKNGSTFINKDEYSWIYENCHKYGFILRYPEGKTEITGIAPESWHFRYVGVPHATYMYQRGKTLEEYMTDLAIYTEDIPLTINVSETESYTVFSVPKSSGVRTEFKLPRNTEYGISGNNIDGFIVWYNNADIGKKEVPVQEEAPQVDTETQTSAQQS